MDSPHPSHLKRLAMLRTLLALLICLIPAVAIGADSADQLTLERDIRPILKEHCFDCHGATEEVEAGLDLRLVRFMISGGESGPAISPGR